MARRLVSATLALAIILAALGVAALVVTGSQAANGKYDTDNDGLIEVSNLEQLNAIRYDLNGDGRPDSNSNTKVYAAAFPEAAPGTVCTKLKPRWDVHLSGDDDQLGCAGKSLSSVLGE